MPYTGASDSKLPEHVKKLSAKKRKQWVEVFNSVFARTSDEGKAMRQANGVVMKTKAAFFKDRSGKMWFVGIFSNNFEDNTGETFTKESHENFAAWLNESGVRPPIVLMHMPMMPKTFASTFHLAHLVSLVSGKITAEKYNSNLMQLYEKSAIAQTRTVIPMEGFMLVIGEVLPDKYEVAQKILKDKNRWGMSHGFIKVSNHDNIITAYHSFEFSVLPVDWAANGLTAINFRGNKNFMDEKKQELTPEQEEVLEDVFEETAADMEGTLASARKMLEDVLASKGVDAYPDIRQKLYQDFKFDELRGVLENVGMQIKALNDRLDAVERDEDEKVAELFEMKWQVGIDTAEVTDENEDLLQQLKGNVPEGVMPDQQETGSVMDITWKNILGGSAQ